MAPAPEQSPHKESLPAKPHGHGNQPGQATAGAYASQAPSNQTRHNHQYILSFGIPTAMHKNGLINGGRQCKPDLAAINDWQAQRLSPSILTRRLDRYLVVLATVERGQFVSAIQMDALRRNRREESHGRAIRLEPSPDYDAGGASAIDLRDRHLAAAQEAAGVATQQNEPRFGEQFAGRWALIDR